MSVTLMDRVQAGDQEAFAELYRTHLGLVRHIVAHRISRAADHPDMIQDIFARVWKTRSQWVDQGRDPAAWISVLARNMCYDELRRRKIRPPADLVGDDTWMLDQVAGGDFERELINGDEVRRGLAALTPLERQAIDMFYRQGLSSAEMGAALGITDQAAKGRLFRARNKMGERIR